MERRAHLSNITPLPSSITRDVALAFLHDHIGMIELNPLVIRHQPTTAPEDASQEEREHCSWYEITDMIHYLPGGWAKGEVSYKGGFFDMPNGLQTHVFAPAGVDLRGKWTVGGNMPGEPREPAELGVDKPKEGLYLREETQLRCNIFLINFVKRNLRKSHDVLVQDLIRKANDAQYQPRIGMNPSLATNARAGSTDIEPQASSPMSSSLQQTQNAMPELIPALHEEIQCSCPNGLHDPMCQNFRYTQVHTASSRTSLNSVHTAREHQPQAAVSPVTAARIAPGSPTSLRFSRAPSTNITGRSLTARCSSQLVQSDSSANGHRHPSPDRSSSGVGHASPELHGQAAKSCGEHDGAV